MTALRARAEFIVTAGTVWSVSLRREAWLFIEKVCRHHVESWTVFSLSPVLLWTYSLHRLSEAEGHGQRAWSQCLEPLLGRFDSRGLGEEQDAPGLGALYSPFARFVVCSPLKLTCSAVCWVRVWVTQPLETAMPMVSARALSPPTPRKRRHSWWGMSS